LHDLVIRNGTVIDGTGRPGFRADVAIDGDRIVAIGRVNDTACRTIEADGHLVTPGFIDPHTHLDAQLFWDPLASSCCWHGITTVVTGNCGVTFAPVHPGDEVGLARILESVEQIPLESMLAGVPFGWSSYGDYLDALAKRPLGVNTAGLVGHVALRQYAMGDSCVEEDRVASDREFDDMRRCVAEALDAGALGFSTSRTASHATPEGVPIPGSYAPDSELMGMAKVLRDRAKGIVQWVAGFGERDQGPDFPRARAEVGLIAAVGRMAERPVVFSTFTHEMVPTLHRIVLEETERERERGSPIHPMFNPRPVLSFIGLANRSPIRASAWKRLYDRPPRERLAALEDETLRQDLCDLPPETQRQVAESTYLFGGPRCEYELSAERRLDRVASRRGESPAATLISLMRETRGKQLFATCGANQVPEAIEEMFEYPGMLVGLGDAGAHVTNICDASMTTYVLAHWARDRGTISVEEAIRRLTSEPAQMFGIRERGRLEAGAYADVNVIDLARLDLELPEFAHDLPAGAGRWTQRARLCVHGRQRPGCNRRRPPHGPTLRKRPASLTAEHPAERPTPGSPSGGAHPGNSDPPGSRSGRRRRYPFRRCRRVAHRPQS